MNGTVLHRIAAALVGVAALAVAAAAQADLAQTIRTAKRSIAAVGTFDAMASPRFAFRGTGFAVGDGNLLVTNAHVLPPADRDPKVSLVLRIEPGSGPAEVRTAVVETLDAAHDLATLRFAGAPLPPLAIADASAVHEGLSIAVIGYPIGGILGYAPVTHHGIISAITAIALPPPTARQLNDTTVRRLREGSFDIYQLDATAYPGNSGGPVLDASTGEVVGVINMVLIKGTKESALSHPTGISYAVPARFVGELIRGR